jgi:hypothetical protein
MPQNSWFNIREGGRRSFCVEARQQAWGLLFLCLVAGMARASPQTRSSDPKVETIITRMAQARVENRARFRPYIVTRDYKLFGKDESKAKSEVIAEVAFVPPDSKKYTIEETNGSGLGQILVRRMLANEAEVTRDYASTDLSADNYDFRFIREADLSGRRCYVLELLPRRIEKHLGYSVHQIGCRTPARIGGLAHTWFSTAPFSHIATCKSLRDRRLPKSRSLR